jgi:hypothetical protein
MKDLNEKDSYNEYEKIYDGEMYSIIPLDYLNEFVEKNITLENKNKIVDLFQVEKIFNKRHETNCISISLFAKCVDNTEEEAILIPYYKNINSKWYKKYYKSLIKFIKDFNKSHIYNNFKIRLYLENILGCYIQHLLSLSGRLEIYYMKCNSIGAQPGMLWRFLTFDDKDLNIVFSSDIDVIIEDHVNRPLVSFIKSDKTMGRLLCNPYYNFAINKNDVENSPLNYAVCLGSMIAFRPKKMDIKIKDTIVNYILYRKYRCTTNNPSEEFDDKNTGRFNRPIGNHTCGWGGIWTMYGFDEKFFKHTILPYLVKKGQVLSWADNCINTFVKDNETNIYNPFMIDYNFVKSYNNQFDLIFS